MPVPNYQPVVTTPDDQLSPEQSLLFAFGTKEAWYTFVGEQDGMEGVPFGRSVAPGDEEWQPNYNDGWNMGNYFRTMAGVNGYNI